MESTMESDIATRVIGLAMGNPMPVCILQFLLVGITTDSLKRVSQCV